MSSIDRFYYCRASQTCPDGQTRRENTTHRFPRVYFSIHPSIRVSLYESTRYYGYRDTPPTTAAAAAAIAAAIYHTHTQKRITTTTSIVYLELFRVVVVVVSSSREQLGTRVLG